MSTSGRCECIRPSAIFASALPARPVSLGAGQPGRPAPGARETGLGMAEPWADRAFLRGTQYKTDANLAARQSIYAFQHPRIDLAARVLDLAAPAPSATIVDVGCGNGAYLAELAKRGFAGRVLGIDLSLGMLAAARDRLSGTSAANGRWPLPAGDPAAGPEPGRPGRPAVRPPAVALASADATALPLRDGVADLALATHMLYHVPDPADALRELRRVTRPGGRVVIVLNGAGHLRQLRAAVAAARGDDPVAMGERVRPWTTASPWRGPSSLRSPGTTSWPSSACPARGRSWTTCAPCQERVITPIRIASRRRWPPPSPGPPTATTRSPATPAALSARSASA